jgi:hypothetical protein
MIDRSQLQGPLGISMVCAAGLFIIGLWLIIPVLGAFGSLGGGDVLDDGTYEQLIATHDRTHRTDLNRVHGRSFFFEPDSPPKPKPPEPTGACCVDEECTIMRRDACRDRGGRFKGKDTTCGPDTCTPPKVPKATEQPKIDTRPKRYAGPDIIAIYGSDVLFRVDSGDGLMVIPVGRSMDNIEIVSVNAPRSVELMWKEGGPFTVPVFERPDPLLSNNALSDVLELPATSPTRTVDEDRPARMQPE